MICLSGLSSVIPLKFLQYFPLFAAKVQLLFYTDNFLQKEMKNLTLGITFFLLGFLGSENLITDDLSLLGEASTNVLFKYLF